jgi:signal transduction histidine kinase
MAPTLPMAEPMQVCGLLWPMTSALADPDLLFELMSTNPAGVVLVEAAGDLPVVYCNASFLRALGSADQQVLGSALPELLPQAERAPFTAACVEAIRTGLPQHLAAGQLASWRGSHYPLRGPAGRVTHVLSFLVPGGGPPADDARRMRRAQERVVGALAGAGGRLEPDSDVHGFLTELAATIGDLVAARRTAFWLYEPAARTMTPQPGAAGFREGQLDSVGAVPWGRGQPGAERGTAHDLLGDMPHRRALRNLGVGDFVVVPWRVGDESLGILTAFDSTRASGFVEEDVWTLQAAAGVAALMWQHRRADRELAESREREAVRLRQQIEQATQLEQLKTDFLKLASHELRGPLGVVRGYLSMIEDGTLGEVGDAVASVLPLLQAKLEEMNQLIDEMLETARLDDDALELRLTRLDLREVARTAIHGLEPLAGTRHRLVVEMPAEPMNVMGNRSRLGMILTNLVHNAIKYSPAGGDVIVRGAVADGLAHVSVRDSGVGIAPADVGRLFTRFGRVTTPDTAAIPGTGLGLYLARDLARRQGGDVDVASASGEGSTFTLTLPAV